MTELSPAAQAVFTAAWKELDYVAEQYVAWCAGSALRAAVEQILPENANPVGDLHDDARHEQWMRIRYKFLSLAAELERKNDC